MNIVNSISPTRSLDRSPSGRSAEIATRSGNGLGRFIKLTSISTFLLILVGSLVTTTGSGLAVPDWPLSFGQFFPPMVGGVLYEHGHRMVAGVVGILMTIAAVWTWFVERRFWVRMLALGAWVAVVAQAILGGITVLYKLPTVISVSHAGLAMAFFSSTVVLAMVTDRSWNPATVTAPRRAVKFWTVAVVLVIYMQIIVGAVMRHMGAGLAIPDFPLSYGMIIPPLHATTVAINFAHRVGALLVGIVIAITLWRMRPLRAGDRILRFWTKCLLALFGSQILLGAFTIWTMKSIHVTTAHIGVGALTLAVSVIMAVRVIRLRWLARCNY